MGEKLDKIIEGYKPIPMKRMMYPRGMKLSEDFVNAFHREFDRLVDEGANPKNLVERFGKALRFHQNEERKYRKMDEGKDKKKSEEELQKSLGNREFGGDEFERLGDWEKRRAAWKKAKRNKDHLYRDWEGNERTSYGQLCPIVFCFL